MKYVFTLFLFILFGVQPLKAESIRIQFYTETIEIAYSSGLLPSNYVRFSDDFFREYYQKNEAKDFDDFLEILTFYKEKYNLNGWLHYKLVQRVVDEICLGYYSNAKEAFIWYVMNRLGYNIRLTHLKGQLNLQAYTTDELFEVPFFELEGKRFVNLTAMSTPSLDYSLEFYLIGFQPNKNGQPLSFSLKQFPKFSPQPFVRKIELRINNEVKKMTVNLDKTIIQLMDGYPIFNENYYIETPISPTLNESLIPQLRQLIKGKTQREALEFLTGFTRMAFLYKEDNEHFGYNKPMIADEVFYYAFSDCEDRSALLYNLVKKLLDLPMIIVAYKDHLTIGVELNENLGKPLWHNGRAYTICDPTGPDNSVQLGIYPKGYQYKKYEVIGVYH